MSLGRIVMIGTSLRTRGGISSVVQVYRAQGLFERCGVRLLETHIDGSAWRKAVFAVRALLQYYALLLSGRVALLHVHSASRASFWRKCLFMLPSFWLRVPVVLHWHGGGFVQFHAECSDRQRRLIASVFRRAARVIALSDQWRATLERMVPGARVVTLTNPIVLPPRAAPLGTPPPAVLFLGQLSKGKGVFDLLQAWPRVLRELPDARLRLAGSGELEAVQRAARALGIEHSVDALGWIDAATRQFELGGAWVLTLPSYNEGVPMAVLEAMAAGVPVVATRVGGIPLAVRDGVDGFLVAPGGVKELANALVKLLRDETLRHRMGTSARQRASEQFAADVIVPRLAALWAEVLAPAAMQETA